MARPMPMPFWDDDDALRDSILSALYGGRTVEELLRVVAEVLRAAGHDPAAVPQLRAPAGKGGH